MKAALCALQKQLEPITDVHPGHLRRAISGGMMFIRAERDLCAVGR